ncbi:hypothetical protein OROHE_003336 [Orobanche hederae]
MDDFEPSVIDPELQTPEHFTAKIRNIPAQKTSFEFDERIDKLLELPVERRKSHLLITEGNLLAVGLRPTESTMSESHSRAKTAPARKETPAERVERLAAERRRRGAAKRKRSDAEAEISVSRTEFVPRAEEFILSSKHCKFPYNEHVKMVNLIITKPNNPSVNKDLKEEDK